MNVVVKARYHVVDVKNGSSVSGAIASNGATLTATSGGASRSIAFTPDEYSETQIDGDSVLGISFTAASTHVVKEVSYEIRMKMGDEEAVVAGDCSADSSLSGIPIRGAEEMQTVSVDAYCYVDSKTRTVRFDANGGENPPDPIQFTIGSSFTLPATAPTLSGKTFYRWTVAGTHSIYNKSATVSATDENFKDNVVLYAMWGNSDWQDSKYDETGLLVYKPFTI